LVVRHASLLLAFGFANDSRPATNDGFHAQTPAPEDRRVICSN
jgi:hypothetical protein